METDKDQESKPEGDKPTDQPKPADENADAQEGEEFDADRAKALISKLRPFETAAKKLERENKDLVAKLKAHEDAQLTEAERKDKRLADLEAEATTLRARERQQILSYEARLAAHELGIVDPDAAVKLADWSTADFGEDGRPTNARAILEQLVADKPYLAAKADGAKPTPTRPAAPNTGATNPGKGTAKAGPVFTESQVRDTAFYRQHEQEILQAFREGRIVAG